MRRIFNIALKLLFPEHCAGCGAENTLLCNRCLSEIDWPEPIEKDHIFASGNYADRVLRETIWILKYRRGVSLAGPLASLMVERAWPKLSNASWIVVPIPLSRKRHKERGYNQSSLLAQKFAELTRNTLKTDVVEKIKDTPSQVTIKDHAARLQNLSGAFRVTGDVRGQNIILIDDVSTTGATIDEARRELRPHGARCVIGLVVARG